MTIRPEGNEAATPWPIPARDRRRLFAFIEARFVDKCAKMRLHERVSGPQLLAALCDGSLLFATRWAEDHGVNVNLLQQALESRGGYCDCEVLLNVERREASHTAAPSASTPVP